MIALYQNIYLFNAPQPNETTQISNQSIRLRQVSVSRHEKRKLIIPFTKDLIVPCIHKEAYNYTN